LGEVSPEEKENPAHSKVVTLTADELEKMMAAEIVGTMQALGAQRGVVTLFGYGIRVSVDRGHLTFEDGIGNARRAARFPRVRHGLRRLVVIGSDGMISLAALRWLADQDAAFVMLDRDGSVLATTGPVRPSDVKLRRAQALAHHSGADLRITRELMNRKLAGQERVARNKLCDSKVADLISQMADEVRTAPTIHSIRQLEAQAAQTYWSAWRGIPVNFPQRDVGRVPRHWQTFGTRKSPLTGSPRLAVNPPNAMLNYLYALLESESRLALAALGLDPGMGVLHVDTPARDSLACDLMEAVRPQVDAYVFDWISREPLRREWFFEKRDGNCRLMAPFAVRLAETGSIWGSAVAPVAEWISRTLWATLRKPARQVCPPTRLTQSRRRQAKGIATIPNRNPGLQPLRVCRSCGEFLKRGRNYCVSCSVPVSRGNLIEAAKLGRIATHSPRAEARRAATQLRHAAARKAWRSSDNPDWLTEELYREKVQPLLARITVPNIATALGVSEPYATDIRAGKRVPHPRHWLRLAQLIG
jgi:CRISPR-associated endonuclease Cas1